MDRARDLSGGRVGTTPRLQRTALAIQLAGAIAHHAVLVDERARHSIGFLALPEFLAGRADIAVALVVVGEVVAREGTVSALGFVEHRDVWLDPLLIDQPVQHLGRAVGGVANQPGRVEIEAFARALDHPLGRRHLGLADRRRRLDIDDDRVVDIDQVVGRIGKERRAPVGRGPARGRIGRRDELRRHLARRAERRIIEDGQILLDRTAGGIRRQTRSTLDAVAIAGVGLDQAGIDGKAFATDQALVDAALQHGLEQLAQQVAVAEAAMPVLREGRMIGHLAVEAQSTKPAVRQVEVHLIAQPPLRANAEAVAERKLRIDRRPPHLAVKRRQLLPQPVEFDKPVDRPQQMASRHMPFERELIKQGVLSDAAFPIIRPTPIPRTGLNSALPPDGNSLLLQRYRGNTAISGRRLRNRYMAAAQPRASGRSVVRIDCGAEFFLKG